MAGNQSQFNADLDGFAQALDVELRTVTARIALGVFRRLILKAPVDTGRFRATWTLNEGAPNWAVQPQAPGGQAGFYAPPSPPAIAAKQPYPLMYIANGLPYASELNDGSSDQAPRMFIELAINEELTVIRSVYPDITP